MQNPYPIQYYDPIHRNIRVHWRNKYGYLTTFVYWFGCFQVNNNGHLTFTSAWSSYSAQRFPMRGSRDLIAGLWTDLNNRVYGNIYSNQYTSGIVLQQASRDINQYFPRLNFNANWVFIATWYGVAYLRTPTSVSHLV